MAIETTCGGCGKLLSVGDENAGRRARCPACGQIYTIPSPQGGPPNLPSSGSAGSEQPTGDSFAETTAGVGATAQAASTPNMDQFWMRSTEGAEYGPVDRTNLNRWFAEGRVGPGYMIRQAETGMWQPAELFKPGPAAVGSMPNSMPSSMPGSMPNSMPTGSMQSGSMQSGAMPVGGTYTSNSNNPYAAAPTSAMSPGYGQMYPKADQSGLVLAFGILSWFLCPIFGVVAWVMGNAGLKDIRLGLVDPANKGLMQAGYYLGMVHIILCTVFCGGYILFIALMIGLGTLN